MLITLMHMLHLLHLVSNTDPFNFFFCLRFDPWRKSQVNFVVAWHTRQFSTLGYFLRRSRRFCTSFPDYIQVIFRVRVRHFERSCDKIARSHWFPPKFGLIGFRSDWFSHQFPPQPSRLLLKENIDKTESSQLCIFSFFYFINAETVYDKMVMLIAVLLTMIAGDAGENNAIKTLLGSHSRNVQVSSTKGGILQESKVTVTPPSPPPQKKKGDW